LPGVRARLLALGVAALAASGCGGDEEPAERTPVTAAGFVECFDKAGFEAKRPAAREESVLAFQARRNGYKVEPVNVIERGMTLAPAAFVVFFESPAKATEAMEELKAISYGEVPPVVRGPAVIGYGDRENRRAVEPAVDACID
jgi:hypothetical protein